MSQCDPSRTDEASPAVADDVYVYAAHATAFPGQEHLLDEVERATLATLHLQRDRDRYVCAHSLLRRALAEHTGVPEDRQRFYRRCLQCGGPHGKPRLLPPGIEPTDTAAVATLDTPEINLSYAGDRILLALRTAGPVGVDIERWEMTAFAGFPAVALTPAEARELHEFDIAERPAARTLWWCRKEAVLKATGHGLRVDAGDLRVSAPDAPPELLEWTDAEIPMPRVTMADLPVPGRYAAALAVSGHVPLHVHLHDVGMLAHA